MAGALALDGTAMHCDGDCITYDDIGRKHTRTGACHVACSALSSYLAQGEYCARNPREVLIGCCVAVLILSLGLVRFRVETDPQRLWVGRGSRALRDKQAYEVRCQDHTQHSLPARL
jgi:Niemann-Pick C1 protein